MIIKTGLTILWTNVNVLLDKNILSPEDIKTISLSVEGIKNAHNIKTRSTASSIFLDMHLVVSNNLSLDNAHKLSHCCENKLREKYPEIKDVLIHIEPEEGLKDEIHYT